MKPRSVGSNIFLYDGLDGLALGTADSGEHVETDDLVVQGGGTELAEEQSAHGRVEDDEDTKRHGDQQREEFGISAGACKEEEVRGRNVRMAPNKKQKIIMREQLRQYFDAYRIQSPHQVCRR